MSSPTRHYTVVRLHRYVQALLFLHEEFDLCLERGMLLHQQFHCYSVLSLRSSISFPEENTCWNINRGFILIKVLIIFVLVLMVGILSLHELLANYSVRRNNYFLKRWCLRFQPLRKANANYLQSYWSHMAKDRKKRDSSSLARGLLSLRIAWSNKSDRETKIIYYDVTKGVQKEEIRAQQRPPRHRTPPMSTYYRSTRRDTRRREPSQSFLHEMIWWPAQIAKICRWETSE